MRITTFLSGELCQLHPWTNGLETVECIKFRQWFHWCCNHVPHEIQLRLYLYSLIYANSITATTEINLLWEVSDVINQIHTKKLALKVSGMVRTCNAVCSCVCPSRPAHNVSIAITGVVPCAVVSWCTVPRTIATIKVCITPDTNCHSHCGLSIEPSVGSGRYRGTCCKIGIDNYSINQVRWKRGVIVVDPDK